jgi:hypothetical protein
MNGILQEKIGVKVEYYTGQNEMKIDMDNIEGSFYANLDKIQINPKIVNLGNLEIKKTGIKMDFKAPVICNPENFDSSKSLMAGVKFEGKDKFAFIDKIEETAKKFSPEWEEAVLKRKEEIQKRSVMVR